MSSATKLDTPVLYEVLMTCTFMQTRFSCVDHFLPMINNILCTYNYGVFLINKYDINDYLVWSLLKVDYLKQWIPVHVNYKLEIQVKIKLNSVFFIFRCVRKIAKSGCYLRHVCPSVRPSAWNNWAYFHVI